MIFRALIVAMRFSCIGTRMNTITTLDTARKTNFQLRRFAGNATAIGMMHVMARNSKIEWCDDTWNIITGCTLVDEGCRHCYAAHLITSWPAIGNHHSRKGLARKNAAGISKFTGEVRFNEDWLDQPLRWKKPRKIFVCAHGDLFHETVPDEWIGGAVRDMTDPMHTICASRKDQNAVILPHLLSLKGTARRDMPINAPHPTVLAGGGHSALIAPHIMTMRNSGKPFNGADEPTHTITAGGAGLSTVAAFLAQHHTGATGHDLRDPLSTIAATGSHQMPVAAWFAKYYGTGDGARTDEPLHTVTTKDRMGHMQAALQAPPFQPEHEARARAVADFLREQGAWDGGEFVTLTIDGGTYVVVDIGMRMLTPRELFNAQGFPPDYQIDGHWVEIDGDWTFKPITKNVQVSCCGNSVCPDLARAIVSANCQHLIAERAAA